MRHTVASHLVMRGATMKVVQELMGHSSITVTMRYSHLAPGHLRDNGVALLERIRFPDATAAQPGAEGLDGGLEN